MNKMLWFYILGWLPSTVAVFGNALVVYIIATRRQLHSLPNVFIVSLAVADVAVGAVFFPTDFFCSKTMMALCNTNIPHLFAILAIYASVWSLCAMTIDRYIAIVKPLRYTTLMSSCRAALLVAFAWLIPLSLDSVPAVCDRLTGKCDLKNKKLIIGKMFMLEILPCFFLIMATTHILIIARRHWRQNNRLDSQLFHNQPGHRRQGVKESSATKVIIVVVLIFLACYSVELYSVAGLLLYSSYPTDEVIKVINFLIIVNSAANPIAYALFKRDIRKELMRTFCKKSPSRHQTTLETTAV
ncbi:octopamine receptor beta-2R-like [Montipora capricornis]|uniref:octopamine receptor beta-2R-like n=1 Tax=Montipora capricornis TaxID=246305 RepID=UPI0035F10858